MCRLTAKRMAQIHSIKVNDCISEPIFFKQVDKFLKNLPENFDNEMDQQKLFFICNLPKSFSIIDFLLRYETEFLPLPKLMKEYELLKNRIHQLQSPIVYCHNDLLLKNLIYDAEKGTLK